MKIKYLVLPLFCISGSVEAKVARLVTFPIPLFVESKDKGSFLKLANEISSRTKSKFKVEVLTSNKAKLAFSNGKAEGFFPGMDNSVPKDALKSTPFYIRTNFIFYREKRPLKTFKELYGKNVGLTFRYHYPAEIQENSKVKFIYADDDVANMRRLADGTIDAFIVEERSGLRALELSKVQGINYSRENPVSSQDCYFAFRNDEEGQNLLKEFNTVLEQMKADGSLQKVLKLTEPSVMKSNL
ncbi:amino acid ABC transporter substrate-binding protein [Bdellovibrio sp. ZAP7]|uniref:substrate-binding periplasmic protein n=1 Tax=Bdellovibrio sp. ZAP7 TaxID=2231053 RepID=UPI00115B5C4F|nr:transporter substrate-binding domain-containing protein [Bdellovibrio sp. ZAP7]QDK45527.1 amino acid ABC transporter substrate-binding protein [Bdellovibrio sp. ZAP7]